MSHTYSSAWSSWGRSRHTSSRWAVSEGEDLARPTGRELDAGRGLIFAAPAAARRSLPLPPSLAAPPPGPTSPDRSPDWFDEAGVMMSMPEPAPADGVLEGVLEHNFAVKGSDAALMADFVRYTLNYDPGLRPDAETCLDHPFVVQ